LLVITDGYNNTKKGEQNMSNSSKMSAEEKNLKSGSTKTREELVIEARIITLAITNPKDVFEEVLIDNYLSQMMQLHFGISSERN